MSIFKQLHLQITMTYDKSAYTQIYRHKTLKLEPSFET